MGWTKLGTHTHLNTNNFKTTAVFFSGKYGFNVLHLCLQSAFYSSHRTSRFLEAVQQLEQRQCELTTQQISCQSPCQVPCLMLLESTTPVYLVVYSCCSQQFCAIVDMCKLCGQDFVHAHTQLSHVHLASTLDITHMIKGTRLSPTLAGRAWERS